MSSYPKHEVQHNPKLNAWQFGPYVIRPQHIETMRGDLSEMYPHDDLSDLSPVGVIKGMDKTYRQQQGGKGLAGYLQDSTPVHERMGISLDDWNARTGRTPQQ